MLVGKTLLQLPGRETQFEPTCTQRTRRPRSTSTAGGGNLDETRVMHRPEASVLTAAPRTGTINYRDFRFSLDFLPVFEIQTYWKNKAEVWRSVHLSSGPPFLVPQDRESQLHPSQSAPASWRVKLNCGSAEKTQKLLKTRVHLQYSAGKLWKYEEFWTEFGGFVTGSASWGSWVIF